MMSKKAIIVVSLVEESAEKLNEEIEKEILEELSKGPPEIPWSSRVEKGHGNRNAIATRVSVHV